MTDDTLSTQTKREVELKSNQTFSPVNGLTETASTIALLLAGAQPSLAAEIPAMSFDEWDSPRSQQVHTGDTFSTALEVRGSIDEAINTELNRIHEHLLQNSEPIAPEIEETVQDNLWELYG